MKGLKSIWQLIKKEKINKMPMDHKVVEELFNELYATRSKRQHMQELEKDIKRRMKEAKQFATLEKEDVDKLTVLAQRIKDIEENKKSLKGRLITNNAALARLTEYEEDLPQMIQEMEEVEKRKRQTQNYMIYLEQERDDLLGERENFLAAYRFLKIFSIGMLIAMIVGLLLAFAMLQILREEIWIYLSGIAALLVLLILGILYAKDYIDKELRKNEILQQKAAKYLNKAKIHYFNETRYLDFEYKKLGVDSVAKLEMHYNRYLKNKDNERIYLKMNHTIGEIEEEMLEILEDRGIKMDHIEYLADWVLNPKHLGQASELEAQLIKAGQEIQAFSEYEDKLLTEAKALGEDPELYESVQKELDAYKSETVLDKTEKDA